MPTLLLSNLIRYVPWIAAGIILVGGAVYVWHLQDTLHAARADMAAQQATIAQLTETNRENLSALKRLQAEDVAWQTTLATTAAQDQSVAVFSDVLARRAAAAPSQDDAAVAPVLAETLGAIAKAQGGKP